MTNIKKLKVLKEANMAKELQMILDDAKAQLEALPGVYDVSLYVARNDLDAKPRWVKVDIYSGSSKFFPDSTDRAILKIRNDLESKLPCFVSFVVSAGRRMAGASG